MANVNDAAPFQAFSILFTPSFSVADRVPRQCIVERISTRETAVHRDLVSIELLRDLTVLSRRGIAQFLQISLEKLAKRRVITIDVDQFELAVFAWIVLQPLEFLCLVIS